MRPARGAGPLADLEKRSGFVVAELAVGIDDRQNEAIVVRVDTGPAVTKDAILGEGLDVDGVALVAAEDHQVAVLILADDEADVTIGSILGAAPEHDDSPDR